MIPEMQLLLRSPEAREAYQSDAMFHAIVDSADRETPGGHALELLGRLLAIGLVADRRALLTEQLRRLEDTPPRALLLDWKPPGLEAWLARARKAAWGRPAGLRERAGRASR